jgi:hypothetical protein
MRNQWVAPQYWLNADGTALANSAAEAVLGRTMPILKNTMQDARILRFTASGKLSTNATPTITFRLRWGGLAGTLLAETEALAMGSGVVNVNWWVDALLVTRSNGASGSLLVQGRAFVHTAAATVLANIFGVSGHDAPADVGSLDLTAEADLAFTGQWSAAHASNTLTPMMQLLEGMN